MREVDIGAEDAAAVTDGGEEIGVGHGRGAAFDPETSVEVIGDVRVAM